MTAPFRSNRKVLRDVSFRPTKCPGEQKARPGLSAEKQELGIGPVALRQQLC
jgi:hypothetical protein